MGFERCHPAVNLMIWKPITLLTILFYAGYTVLCLMPLGLELWTEYQFRKVREDI